MSGISFSWEKSEVTALAAKLAKYPAEVDVELRDIVRENARTLTKIWRNNAQASAGAHGKLYPGTIFDHVNGMDAYIEPQAGLPQAGMAFEYGGPSVIRNPNPKSRPQRKVGSAVGQSKPHLDMNRAADIVFPLFQKEVADQAVIRL